MSEGTSHDWMLKHSGMKLSETKRLKALKDENAKGRSPAAFPLPNPILELPQPRAAWFHKHEMSVKAQEIVFLFAGLQSPDAASLKGIGGYRISHVSGDTPN